MDKEKADAYCSPDQRKLMKDYLSKSHIKFESPGIECDYKTLGQLIKCIWLTNLIDPDKNERVNCTLNSTKEGMINADKISKHYVILCFMSRFHLATPV